MPTRLPSVACYLCVDTRRLLLVGDHHPDNRDEVQAPDLHPRGPPGAQATRRCLRTRHGEDTAQVVTDARAPTRTQDGQNKSRAGKWLLRCRSLCWLSYLLFSTGSDADDYSCMLQPVAVPSPVGQRQRETRKEKQTREGRGGGGGRKI